MHNVEIAQCPNKNKHLIVETTHQRMNAFSLPITILHASVSTENKTSCQLDIDQSQILIQTHLLTLTFKQHAI